MRRIGFAVAAFAALLAACGKQVTPDLPGVGPGGLSGGYTSVRFDVAGTMDFANYQYIVAFNTTGTTVTPGTNTPASYDGYSYAVVVGGNAGGTYASIWEYARTPGLSGNSQPTLYQVGTTPAQVQYVANSNGDYTEFTVSFARIVFSGIKPTGSATPPPVAGSWRFNAFTGQRNALGTWVYTDSLGAGGGSSAGPQWTSPALNVGQRFDQTFYALDSDTQIVPAAAIVSVEIANAP